MNFSNRIVNDFDYPKLVGNDLVLWVLHADKIPPHIGISIGSCFYSLKSNGKDDGIDLNSLFKVVESKRIGTLSFTLSKDCLSHDVTSIFDKYEVAKSGSVTCLHPIREILNYPEVNHLVELLNELEMGDEIKEIRSYFLPDSFCQIKDYNVQDIHKRLILLEAKKTDLTIRPIDSTDIDQVLSWENNPELWEVSQNESEYSREDIVNLIEELKDFKKCKQARWIIGLENHPIGTIDVFNVDFNSNSCEVGVFIEKEYRKSGYGLMALRLVELEDKLISMNSIKAKIFEQNQMSINLFLKAGYKKIDSINLRNVKNGTYIQTQLFEKCLKS